MTSASLRLAFAGTPEFSVPCFEACRASGAELVAVYTQPDRPAGRGRKLTPSPVKQAALAAGVAIEQPESLKTAEVQQRLADYRPDLLVVVAYGLILPRKVKRRAEGALRGGLSAIARADYACRPRPRRRTPHREIPGALVPRPSAVVARCPLGAGRVRRVRPARARRRAGLARSMALGRTALRAGRAVDGRTRPVAVPASRPRAVSGQAAGVHVAAGAELLPHRPLAHRLPAALAARRTGRAGAGLRPGAAAMGSPQRAAGRCHAAGHHPLHLPDAQRADDPLLLAGSPWPTTACCATCCWGRPGLVRDRLLLRRRGRGDQGRRRAGAADAGAVPDRPPRPLATPRPAHRRLALGRRPGAVLRADPGLAAADAAGGACRRRPAARRVRAEHPVRTDRAPLRHADWTHPLAVLFPRHHRGRLAAAVTAVAVGTAGVVAPVEAARRALPAAAGLDRADPAVLLAQPRQARRLHPAGAADGRAGAGTAAARPAAPARRAPRGVRTDRAAGRRAHRRRRVGDSSPSGLGAEDRAEPGPADLVDAAGHRRRPCHRRVDAGAPRATGLAAVRRRAVDRVWGVGLSATQRRSLGTRRDGRGARHCRPAGHHRPAGMERTEPADGAGPGDRVRLPQAVATAVRRGGRLAAT
ncbi:Methionyl-tRNA formyltransferase [Rhodanobacter lindaniclasticus]